MPEVVLKGHDYKYAVSDVLRLFYGEANEKPEGISAGSDGTIIFSKYDGSGVCTESGDICRCFSYNESQEIPFIPKREVKRQLYSLLSEMTGITYPWGSLTGIRPTLIATECGYDPVKMSESYYSSFDKSKLACETALNENRMIDSIANNSYHIYLSVPVCPTLCDYCSFPTADHISVKAVLDDYVCAIVAELKDFIIGNKSCIGSIYIGGGTPTVLNDRQFEFLLSSVNDLADISSVPEFTIEAGRPETITDSKILIMMKYGVSRVCVNPQTFNAVTLDRIGRKHTVKDIYDAYRRVRNGGFRSISMDLIAGLGDESKDDFLYSLTEMIGLRPENITVHSLSLKRSSMMKRKFSQDPIVNPVMDFKAGSGNIDGMLADSYKILALNDYKPYYMYRQKDTLGGNENTGFSLKDHECIYNCAMMGDRNTIVGFGAKAISKKIVMKDGKVLIERLQNPADVRMYITRSSDLINKKREFFYEPDRNI
ncbi:MAG: coproporphyrinogen dehydrogenase HemZ [Eubacteriales bacterium]|nr:coproporphyrinogen dehydrogenase HemZ [Eubacteriales bacterium]